MTPEEEKNVFLESLKKGQEASEGQSQGRKKKGLSGIALFATLFLLFLLVITLLIFIISIGGANNPILQSFGIDSAEVKEFLKSLVNWVFGALTILLLLLFSIGLFRAISAKKEEKQKRRRSLLFGVVCGGLIFAVVLAWLGMFTYITNLPEPDLAEKYKIQAMNMNVTDSITAPATLSFSAGDIEEILRQQGRKVQRFLWDKEGDGIFEIDNGKDPNIDLYFSDQGRQTIALLVELENGETEKFQIAFNISQVVFEALPSSGEVPLTVEFNASEVTRDLAVRTYEWDFEGTGEYESSSSPKTIHTFETIGIFPVKLRVILQDDRVKNFEREVTVLGSLSEDTTNAPSLFMTTNPRADDQGRIRAEKSPLLVSFDATKTTDAEDDIVSFEWDFTGDGIPDAYGEKAEYEFITSGTFAVTLTVIDAKENRSTKEILVITQKDAVSAIILATPETGAAPLTIEFDGSHSTCGDECHILSYEWNFNDGTPVQVTGAHTTHTYTKVGTFSVQLKVTTDSGETAEGEKIVAVRVPPLSACFTSSRIQGTAPLTITFQDCSEGTTSFWKWDFGDGFLSEEQAPTHVFQDSGEYTVILSITNENGTTSQASENITAQ